MNNNNGSFNQPFTGDDIQPGNAKIPLSISGTGQMGKQPSQFTQHMQQLQQNAISTSNPQQFIDFGKPSSRQPQHFQNTEGMVEPTPHQMSRLRQYSRGGSSHNQNKQLPSLHHHNHPNTSDSQQRLIQGNHTVICGTGNISMKSQGMVINNNMGSMHTGPKSVSNQNKTFGQEFDKGNKPPMAPIDSLSFKNQLKANNPNVMMPQIQMNGHGLNQNKKISSALMQQSTDIYLTQNTSQMKKQTSLIMPTPSPINSIPVQETKDIDSVGVNLNLANQKHVAGLSGHSSRQTPLHMNKSYQNNTIKSSTGVGSLNILNEGLTTSSGLNNGDGANNAGSRPTGEGVEIIDTNNSQFNEVISNNLKFQSHQSRSNVNLAIDQTFNQNVKGNYNIQPHIGMKRQTEMVGSDQAHSMPNGLPGSNSQRSRFGILTNFNRSIDDGSSSHFNKNHFTSNSNQFPSIGGKQGQAGGIENFGGIIGKSSQVVRKGDDDKRKMSLAAKAGQMQIFNNLNSGNLNNSGTNNMKQYVNSSGTDPTYGENDPIHGNHGATAVSHKQMALTLSNNTQNDPKQLSNYSSFSKGGTKHIANPSLNINGTQCQNQSALPPAIPKNSQSLNNRHAESLLGRRQMIEQQREKKQELLKQLEIGRVQSNSSKNYPFHTQQNTGVQNSQQLSHNQSTSGMPTQNEADSPNKSYESNFQSLGFNQGNVQVSKRLGGGTNQGNMFKGNKHQLGKSFLAGSNNASFNHNETLVDGQGGQPGFNQIISPTNSHVSMINNGLQNNNTQGGISNMSISGTRPPRGPNPLSGSVGPELNGSSTNTHRAPPLNPNKVSQAQLNLSNLDQASRRRHIAALNGVAGANIQGQNTVNQSLQNAQNISFQMQTKNSQLSIGMTTHLNNSSTGTGKYQDLIQNLQNQHAQDKFNGDSSPIMSPPSLKLQKQAESQDTTKNISKSQMTVQEMIRTTHVHTDANTGAHTGRHTENSSMQPSVINSHITRKLEGGRPHKVYDYMFIQMSNEQFNKEYQGRKIQIIQQENNYRENQFCSQNTGGNAQSPRGPQYVGNGQAGIDNHQGRMKFFSPNKNLNKSSKVPIPGIGNQSPRSAEVPNLNGLVKIRAYDKFITDELPQVSCNLLPTQLDHLKVLLCEQDDKNHPKLTPEAQNRFEMEKQNQIKQYMEDIIEKLKQKERKFKVSLKKKFIEDALYNSTSIRVASVYVVVLNREKTYDPMINQKVFKVRKSISENLINGDSSEEEDEATQAARDEYSRQADMKNNKNRKESLRRSANPNLINKKRSLYDSDTNGVPNDNMNSTSASSNMPHFKKLIQDKNNPLFNDYDSKLMGKKKQNISLGPSFKKMSKKDEEIALAYKYTTPVKEFPAKYGKPKIKIVQDINAHNHMKQNPFSIFQNQYNEFIRLIFKQQKTGINGGAGTDPATKKQNQNYAMGLSRALGMNLKKDAFSEQNMKSRDHMLMLKEKLIFCFYKKIIDENKDLSPPVAIQEIPNNSGSEKNQIDLELDGGSSVDSNSNQNNQTPKSRSLAVKQEPSLTEQSGIQISMPVVQQQTTHKNEMIYPPPNILYKYYIGKGNNSIMVRSLFKNRFWWVQSDKEDMATSNFCWTQIKNQKIMEVLQCKYPNRMSGITHGLMKKGQQGLTNTPQPKSSKKKRINQQNSDKVISSKSMTTNPSCINPQNIVSTGNPERDHANKFLEARLYNKIEDNFHMNNKKALYLNMKNYYEAMDQDMTNNMPLTFHIKNGLDDPEFHKFKSYYFKYEEEIKIKKMKLKQKRKDDKDQRLADQKKQESGEPDTMSPQQSPDKKSKAKDINEEPQYYQSQIPPKNIWIIKPGENTNRGHGIQVAKEFNEVKAIIEESTTNRRRTCIVQQYIYNPLLINKRKFDIRTYALLTSVNGNMKGYIYEEGYLRTSCREFSINNLNNKLIHLTNDAVQKRAEDYGKYEPGNKISYNEFQIYFDKNYPDLNICFERDILPQMNKITTDIFRACHGKLDPKRRLHTMEVFGLDFMIDDEFKPYLIEVNTNPCLELASPLLARLIPNMLENAFKIGLDPVFMPPEHFSSKKAFIGDACPENRFQICFDDRVDGPVLEKLFKTQDNIIFEMDEDELSEEEVHDDDE